MVQSVEGLRSELQLLSLGQEEALVKAKIEIIDARLTDSGAPSNTIDQGSSLNEAGLVEILRLASGEAFCWVTDLLCEEGLVWGRSLHGVAFCDTHRQAGREMVDACKLPARRS